MDFQSPLYRAFLIRRYAKVLADARLETGETVTAFCSNTTRMAGLCAPNTEIGLSYRPRPFRRLQFVWETAVVNGTTVGVNQGLQCGLVAEAVANGALYELGGYARIERPTAMPHVDFLLTPRENSGYPVCKVAIAPVYRKDGVDLLFPDGVDVANHYVLRTLENALRAGERAVLLPLAQRIDAIGVRAAWQADAPFLAKLRDLYDKGLEIICCGCSVSSQGVRIAARLPFMF